MITSQEAHLKTAALTHPGLSGKENEDRYGLSFYRLEDNKTPVLLAIVADGVGGHQAGEIAAEMTVENLTRAVSASDGSKPTRVMMQALYDTNRQIHQKATGDLNLAGMGTTCTAALIIGSKLYAMNVGNSRLYLLRDGELKQLSIDHSWVQEALDHGVITPEQAKNHPNQRIITRYVGAETMHPDMRLKLTGSESDEEAEANQGMALSPNDMLFLCSDGLSDLVEDHEIHEIITDHPMQKALEELTVLACDRGGHDNITSILLQVPGTAEPTIPSRRRAKRPQPGEAASSRDTGLSRMVWVFIILALVVALGAIVASFVWFNFFS